MDNYNFSSSVWEQRDPRVHINYFDKHEALSTSRRFYIGLVVYMLVASLFMTLVGIVLAIVAPEIYQLIGDSALWMIIINAISMYLIGTPILYLIVRNSRTRTFEKRKLGAENLIFLLLICQFLTIAGNLLGRLASFIINTLTGAQVNEGVTDMLTELPLGVIFLIVVVVGPIFEEIIFRKLLIDRFGVYGDKLAITVSALAFGAFHGNFEQFFYTSAVGAVWAYVYIRTGKLRYSIFMHMVMNFIDGFLPMYVLTVNEYIMASSTLGLLVLQYGAAIAGCILLVISFAKRWYPVSREPIVYLPKRNIPRFLIFNIGAIIFILFTAFQFATYHLMPIIEDLLYGYLT